MAGAAQGRPGETGAKGMGCCVVQKRFLITGGASPEVEVSYQLSKWSKTLQVRVVCV